MHLVSSVFLLLLPHRVASQPPPPDRSLIWYAPFHSGGGYSSEATAFVEGLSRTNLTLASLHHGDAHSLSHVNGRPAARSALFTRLSSLAAVAAADSAAVRIIVCHSEPGAWDVSRVLPARYSTENKCPPVAVARDGGALVRVGRTMFESDRLPAGWSERLNGMDEVWVPTAFAARIFADGGVDSAKIRVVPEPVDALGEFSPAAGELVKHRVLPPRGPKHVTRFLFVGKFERRKGIDILLAAYATAFLDAPERAELFVLTAAYHSTADFDAEIARVWSGLVCKKTEHAAGAKRQTHSPLCIRPEIAAAPPRVRLLSAVSQMDLPGVYASVDALVQPSRGEGWGRPHVEAMAMGLPVIATNWSGPTAFLTQENGYLLPYTHLEPVPDGAFKGHLMAEPDARALASILRQVADEPVVAKGKGAKARSAMLSKFSLDVVASLVTEHVDRIVKEKLGGAQGDGAGEGEGRQEL